LGRVKAGKLAAWQAVLAVERSWKAKDEFFDLVHKAYRRHPRKTEEIRRKLAKGEIGLERALRELESLARG